MKRHNLFLEYLKYDGYTLSAEGVAGAGIVGTKVAKKNNSGNKRSVIKSWSSSAKDNKKKIAIVTIKQKSASRNSGSN